MRVIITRIGRELIALDVASVTEVIDAPEVAALPLSPRGLAGQIAYRGAFLPVLDPAVLLGVAREGGTGAVLVLAGAPAALWVDDAEDVWAMEESEVRIVPSGSDTLGVLRGLLSRGTDVVAHVDAGALAAAALATLRQGSEP